MQENKKNEFENSIPEFKDDRLNIELNKSVHPKIIEKALNREFAFNIFKLIIASAVLIAGIFFILKGYQGAINLDFGFKGGMAKITNSSPGILMTLISILLIRSTAINFKVK